MKKIVSMLSILLFFTVNIFAQTTVSIPDTTSADSTAIVIPVKSGALDSVASLSIFISYDKSVLTFNGIVDNPFAGSNFLVNDNNGVISISWFSLTPVKITNKLFALDFFYKSGSSALTFTGTNQITNLKTSYNITFVDGSIGSLPAAMGLGSATGLSGDTVSVAYTGTNLNNVGSITTYIDYDTSAVKYAGLSSNDIGFTNNSTAGQVILAWYDTNPYNHNAGNLAVLKFVVKSGNTNLVFNSSTQVTDINGNALSISYTNGSITEIVPPGQVPTFTLGNAKGSPGFNINVPLNATKITDLASFTMKVSYDTSVIHYVGYANLISGTLTGNESNGELTVGWFDTNPVTIADGKFADLVFAYNTGTTNLTMTGVEFTDISGGSLNITLMPGSVSEGMVKISQIQQPAPGDTTGNSPFVGHHVITQGVVTANYVKNSVNKAYFVQDGSGMWNGIYVYDSQYTPAEGDSVTISGTVDESLGLTKIRNVDNLVVINSGNDIPQAVDINGAELNSNGEAYESVIVYIPGLATVSEANSAGQAVLNDGTGDVTTDDMLYSGFSPLLGYTYDIRGIIYYSSHEYKLLPVHPDDITGIDDKPNSIPTKYSLGQNYPNPFNPSTMINFSLKDNSKVNLSVYNLLGQKVATLINKNMSAGYKTFNFDASNLATGVYLYRIVVKGSNGASYINSKKMILLK